MIRRRNQGRSAFSLLDLFARLGARPYDWMYTRGAPWESGPREELVRLIESGRITPSNPGPSALDVGCGSGADSIFLASRGFDATGFDFSSTAIAKAEEAARRESPEHRPRFLIADLFDLPLDGPFDLIFDGGTIDDFPPKSRKRVAEILTDLARPGTVLVMWCFQMPPEETPLMSFSGASRWGAPPIYPGEEQDLFGAWWEIEPVQQVTAPSGAACFLMTRR